VAECARAETVIGPLRTATPATVDSAAGALDDVAWRRARHVVTENQRVRDLAAALAARDYAAAGAIMVDGHRSLRDDFDTSTPTMDEAVAALVATPGVYGARMTGGGFGGCVVAIARPGTLTSGWLVRASRGAHHC
jgi:galactokinase